MGRSWETWSCRYSDSVTDVFWIDAVRAAAAKPLAMSSFLEAASQPAAALTLAIFAGAILLFITGWITPEVTGLLAMALLVATRVLQR